MKKIFLTLILLSISISAYSADQLVITIDGTTKKCADIDPRDTYNVCTVFNGFAWGYEIPGYNPKPGTKVKAKLTIGNYNDTGSGEFMLKVYKNELIYKGQKMLNEKDTSGIKW